ncbi:YigZ family protein [Shewanella sp. NIFS-20-20]|uniref:YigZ family protein n=1 Tax=Shewanella sp. NIFS-20-20 TaxID=2853806 RepID=UPI001C44101C|nr:YigZ family protein [Shewanella sp. NIFS-20-20]MBV7315573.1 YigZ family protein [Shewanella sp. NIFS-20-20]
MIESYFVPDQEVQFEEEIKQSRFISFVFPVTSEPEFNHRLAEIRQQWPNASHYCYAARWAAPDNDVSIKSSDDGEPAGSAGRPMLALLSGSDLGEVGAVVVRYYGGTKLGVGGLVRAYTSGVRHCLTLVAKRQKQLRYPAQVVCGYHELMDMEYLLNKFDALLTARYFEQEVRVEFEVSIKQWPALLTAVQAQFQGRLQLMALSVRLN